jgi:O-Antigen ligase
LTAVTSILRLRAGPREILCGAAALLALGLFAGWTASNGGFFPTTWYPGALVLLAAAVAVVLAGPSRVLELPRGAIWALALLAGFTAWNYLSIAWAGVPGDAWEGANRTALYLVVYALFILIPWRAGHGAVAIGVFSLAIAIVGLVAFIAAAGSDTPESHFFAGRFSEPVGYVNGNAAAWLIAFWPALYLSSRLETPWPLRGVMLAAAGLLFQLALLPQSRGVLFSLPIVAALYFALVPGRARSLGVVLLLGGAMLLWAGPIADFWNVANAGGDLRSPLADAKSGIRDSCLALLLVGSLVAFLDWQFELSDAASRMARRMVGVASLAAAVLGTVLLLGAIGSPTDWVSKRWHEFIGRGEVSQTASSRYSAGLGGNRYDFWRVGMRVFGDHPIAGVGSDNYAADYVRRREALEEPKYPHSVEIRVLQQTGLVGMALFGGFLVAALAAAWWARGDRSRFAAGVAGTALVGFAYWFVHGSGDWFWEFPALGGPAFAFLAMAARLGPEGEEAEADVEARPGPALVGLVVVAAMAVSLSFFFPWRAAEQIGAVTGKIAEGEPGAALEKLRSARRLNPLTEQPDIIAAAIDEDLGARVGAAQHYRQALERNPDAWFPELQLGALASLARDWEAALRHMRRAAALNPHEEVVTMALRRVRARRVISPREVRRFLQRRVVSLGLVR